MKKLFCFTVSVFIVSIFFYSCNKDDNPASTTGGTTTSSTWTSQYRSGLNITIGPGVTDDTMNVIIPPLDFPTNYIKNVNLILDNIEGVDASQLKFDLIHQGDTVRVIDTLNNGGPNNNFIHTVLSDSSSDPIRTATSPFTGIFQPENSLSAFKDLQPEGSYILRITNSGSYRTGVIKSWGITVSYSPVMSNYCLEFDGTSDYAQIPNSTSINSIILDGTFTIEGWYKILGFPNYDYFSFLDKQNSWYFEYSQNDTAWTFVEPGDTTAKARLPIIYDSWYHIAMTYNHATGTVKFYSNGQLIGTVSQSYTFVPNTNSLYIARGISGANEYGYGRYDEIRIWNIIRTDAEIANNYNRSLTGSESGLVLYYKLSEGSGLSINDASPNGNSGSLFGNPIWRTDGPNITP